MTPPGAVPLCLPARRILAHVLTGQPATTAELVEAAGRARSTVHGHVQRLACLGLVDWQDGRQGTLHPTCVVVPLPEA